MTIVNHIGLTILHSSWVIVVIGILVFLLLNMIPASHSRPRYYLGLSGLGLSILSFVGIWIYFYYTSSGVVIPYYPEVTGPVVMLNEAISGPGESIWMQMIRRTESFAPYLAWGWYAGVLVMMLRMIGGLYGARILVSNASLYQNKEAYLLLQDLAKKIGLNSLPKIKISFKISEPISIGYLSPAILLPAGLVSGYSTEDLKTILVHELYHIKFNDYLINLIQSLVEVVLFFHPVVWWISAQVRKEREHRCDDKTIALLNNKSQYLHTLARLTEQQHTQKPALSLGLLGKHNTLYHRIKRQIFMETTVKNSKKQVISIGIIVVGLIFFSFYPNKEQGSEISVNEGTFANIEASGKDTIPTDSHKFSDEFLNDMGAALAGLENKTLRIDGKQVDTLEEVDPAEMEEIEITIPGGKKSNLINVKTNTPKSSLTEKKSGEPRDTTAKTEPAPRGVGLYSKSGNLTTKFYDTDNLVIYGPAAIKMESTKNLDSADKNPLFIVNGFRIAQQDLNNIDPNMIESINILKGQQAIDQYGEAGAYGVIIIKMKPEYSNVNDLEVYPNPVKDEMKIRFSTVNNNTNVIINLLDASGQRVAEITNNVFSSGTHTLSWFSDHHKKGTYFLYIQVGEFKTQYRIVLD